MDNGDLVICVSGSGNSKNIISALEYANKNNATTLAILGYDGGKAIKIAHHSILVPSFDIKYVRIFIYLLTSNNEKFM